METETDWLTGLMGRTAFLEHMEIATQAAAPFSVLLIDLDRLAHLNHDHTHHAGDEVLRSLARFLEQNVRGIDSIFRYGEMSLRLM